MPVTERSGLDRRCGEDRRQVYDMDYFTNGGLERRIGQERRSGIERRKDWVKISEWSSIPAPDESSSVFKTAFEVDGVVYRIESVRNYTE